MGVDLFSTTSSIDSLIAKYMQIERQPVVALEKRKSDLNVEKAIYNDVESYLNGLLNKVKTFTEPEGDPIFSGKLVTSSDDKVVSGTAEPDALPARHTIFVERLASSDRVLSNRMTSSGTTLSAAPGTKTFTVSVGGESKSIEVTVVEGETNQVVLEHMAAAINASGLKVRAAVVSEVDGTSRLVLTSTETGTANFITLADESGTLLADAGLRSDIQSTGDSGGYLKPREELDARFILDGLTFTRSSNVVKDAIAGVELRLSQSQTPGEGEIELEVTQDVGGAKKRVQELLDEYNRLMSYLREKTKVDGETFTRGPLANEITLRGFINQMRYIAQDRVDASPFGRLEAIGITVDVTGKLLISDESKFSEAVRKDPAGVEALFTSENGFASRLEGLLSPMVEGEGSYIRRKKETIDSFIKSLNDRIDSYERRLAMKEESLRKEFSSLLSALAMLQQQQATLNSFMNMGFFGQF